MTVIHQIIPDNTKLMSTNIVVIFLKYVNPTRPRKDQTHSCQSETRSDQMLAKLINQGAAAAVLSSKRPKKC